jgi:hypothetical protein
VAVVVVILMRANVLRMENKKGIYNCGREILWKDHVEVIDTWMNIRKINLKECD